MRILHCSDIHLGRRRLDGRLPDTDLFRVFQHLIKRALAWPADVVLIAGDLFDNPQIPPAILRQAVEALSPLRQHGIPAIAIEGNHDRVGFPGIANTQTSWVQYLGEERLLSLLSIPFRAEGPLITPFDSKTQSGSYLDYGGIRFIGAGYLGAGTPRKVNAILDALPEDSRPTVMLLHAGPEYFVGEGGGFEKETLAQLRERITYLALGHIHRPMIHRDGNRAVFALNPGSPENCRLQESDCIGPRGYAEVEIDPNAFLSLALKRAEIFDTPRRPIVRVMMDVTPYGNKLKEGAESITAAVVAQLAGLKVSSESILRVFLTGALNIGRIALEPQVMARAIESRVKLAAVEVDIGGVQLYTGRLNDRPLQPDLPNSEIERLALEDLLRQRPLDGLEDCIPQTAQLFAKLKSLVAHNAPQETILEVLSQSELPALVASEQRKVGI